MKEFKIPVTWQMYGEIKVFADNEADAYRKATMLEEDIPCPDGEYVDSSFEINFHPGLSLPFKEVSNYDFLCYEYTFIKYVTSVHINRIIYNGKVYENQSRKSNCDVVSKVFEQIFKLGFKTINSQTIETYRIEPLTEYSEVNLIIKIK